MNKNILKELYNSGRIDDAGLRKAVVLKWITSSEYEEITGRPY